MTWYVSLVSFCCICDIHIAFSSSEHKVKSIQSIHLHSKLVVLLLYTNLDPKKAVKLNHSLALYSHVQNLVFIIITDIQLTLDIPRHEYNNMAKHAARLIKIKHCLDLIHWGPVMYIYITNHHWFRQWLVPWPAPSHYLNQCWSIVMWNIGNKLQWNLNKNSNIFIQENAFECVVFEMAAILSRPQCVKLIKDSSPSRASYLFYVHCRRMAPISNIRHFGCMRPTRLCLGHNRYRHCLWILMLNKWSALTHWGQVTHICISKLTIIGSDNGMMAPSHYLKQRWNIVNLNLANKVKWIFNWIWYIFIQENAFENVACEMAAILSWPQCVNSS